MGRIMGIDYGKKRVGIAVTDPLQLIASGLETIPADTAIAYLTNYISTEPVERFVVGLPIGLDDQPTDATPIVEKFIIELKKAFPDIPVSTIDESFTSKKAKSVIFQSGAKKKKRRDKSLIDKVSAALILQDYMEKSVW